MSTDRKRLNSAIQRIAREDPEIRKLLDDFRNSGGKPSEPATSGSGAEDRQICCDGGTSGSTNPGSDTRDTSDGGQDGLGGDPANLDDMGGGSLTGVTDCATGQPICFEGSDWIPPEGWEDPQEPPIDPEYDEGVYWEGIVAGSQSTFQTPSAAKSFVCPPLCDCITSTGGSQATCDTCSSEDEGFFTTCGGENYSWGSLQCSDDPDPICDEDPPLLEEWPEDGCVNLAQKGGKLVGSKFDPENDGTYSKPMSEIELCDGSGNSFFLSPSSDGGWKTIDATKTDGYLYDSQGNKIAHIDGNEYADPDV